MAITSIRGPLATDAGLFALWDYLCFQHIVDMDAWETELLDDADIERHVQVGRLVPINIRSDGAFEFEARVGVALTPVALSERERKCLTVSSAPYLLVSSGQTFLSGIEAVGNHPGSDALQIPLPPGRYEVSVHILEWDQEPGARQPNGAPAPTALPDFVLLINPASDDQPYRQSAITFPDPSGA